MAATYSTLGFIGLGAMGEPMIGNLARKLPDCRIHVYDVSKEAMDKISARYPQVKTCRSSKETAEESVS